MINKVKHTIDNPSQIHNMLIEGEITPGEALTMFSQLERYKIPFSTVNEEESLEDVMKELDQLIGLSKVKYLVKEIQAFAQIQKKTGSKAFNRTSSSTHDL